MVLLYGFVLLTMSIMWCWCVWWVRLGSYGGSEGVAWIVGGEREEAKEE